MIITLLKLEKLNFQNKNFVIKIIQLKALYHLLFLILQRLLFAKLNYFIYTLLIRKFRINTFYLSAITKQPVMTANLMKKSSICFRTDNKIAILKDSILSNTGSSNSFILSLAQFLNSLKTIIPPNLMVATKLKKKDNYNMNKQQNGNLLNYYEIWCDYLFNLLCEGSILVMGEVVVLTDVVSNQFFHELQALAFFKIESFELNLQKKLAKKDIYAIFAIKQQSQIELPKPTKKIAIINFSSSVLYQDKFKPKIHIEGLISGILYNEGDQWHSYRILKKDIPTLENLLKYDSIILSGSSYSVNSMPPEIKAFKTILSEALEINHTLKILGICFGHQFIANILGSQIITKPLNKGPQDIEFLISNFQGSIPYLEETFFNSSNELRLYKFHNDHVATTPRGFVNLATSNKCQVDALVSLDKRIFTMQFHPEFTTQYIKSYLNRCDSYNNTKQIQIKTDQLDAYHHKSLETFRRSLRKFLNWNN